jgi:hypothetical protein
MYARIVLVMVFGLWAGGVEAQEGFEWVVKPGEYEYYQDHIYLEKLHEGLLAITKKGKSGFIDTTGVMRIPTIYEDVKLFEEGLAAVKLNDKWGFINSKGNTLISHQYEKVGNFKDGRAAIYKGGKWGFIDKLGKVVIPCQFESVADFSEGLTKVQLNSMWGFIDTSGNTIIPCRYYKTTKFKKRLATVQLVLHGKWGVIDKDGKIVVPILFTEVIIEEDVIALLQNEKWGFTNHHGEFIAKCQFDNRDELEEGYIPIQIDSLWGCMDIWGKIIFPCVYDYIEISSGLVAIRKKEKWGVFDLTGKAIIPCEYNHINIHNSGFIAVNDGRYYWTLADRSGHFLIPFPCYINEIREEFVITQEFRIYKSYGLMDIRGKQVIPYQFELMHWVRGAKKLLFVTTSQGQGLIKPCITPLITWQYPILTALTTTQTQHRLKACIESNCQITDISLYINGVLQSSPGRDMLIKPASCTGHYFEQNITLPPGRSNHEIELVVTTPAGTFSSKRSIQMGEGNQAIDVKQVLPPEKRIALVIGNSNYRYGNPLGNPKNDAEAMKGLLDSLGFKVYLQVDVSYQSMVKAVNNFGVNAQQYDLALVYYAGHGIQYKGENYLLPIDAQLEFPENVESECINLGRILGNLAGAKVRVGIVILDACRTNPFERKWGASYRGNTPGGLSAVQAPQGTLIAFAADANQTADDNSKERNGLYTAELLRSLRVPGLTLEQVFRRTRTAVTERAKRQDKVQEPAEYSKLTGGDVILNRN